MKFAELQILQKDFVNVHERCFNTLRQDTHQLTYIPSITSYFLMLLSYLKFPYVCMYVQNKSDE